MLHPRASGVTLGTSPELTQTLPLPPGVHRCPHFLHPFLPLLGRGLPIWCILIVYLWLLPFSLSQCHQRFANLIGLFTAPIFDLIDFLSYIVFCLLISFLFFCIFLLEFDLPTYSITRRAHPVKCPHQCLLPSHPIRRPTSPSTTLCSFCLLISALIFVIFWLLLFLNLCGCSFSNLDS